MSDETNMMEGDILGEEVLSEPTKKPSSSVNTPKNPLPKIDPKIIKTKLSGFKKPKLITIALIFIALVACFSMLIVLGVKRPKEEIVNPDIIIASPKQTNNPDKTQTEMEKNLSLYEEKVKNLNTSIRNYPPPKLDLEIKF